MALETEGKILDINRVTSGAKNLILTPKYGQYYIAVTDDGTPIGCTMFTCEMNARLGGVVCMIQSVFVVKEWRNKGVFRALFGQVVETAKNDPLMKAVRLYVEHDNLTAQTVYEKLGMNKMDSWNFDEKDFIF